MLFASYPVYRNGECVGRIAGVIDENNNRYHDEKNGVFWVL
jgi:hypothetical protein